MAKTPGASGLFYNIVYGQFYNEFYIKRLIKKGFKAFTAKKGMLPDVVSELNDSQDRFGAYQIPIMTESENLPTVQQPNPTEKDIDPGGDNKNDPSPMGIAPDPDPKDIDLEKKYDPSSKVIIPTPDQTNIFCGKCGKSNSRDNKFCTQCGQTLTS